MADIKFTQDKNGYWEPDTGRDMDRAAGILREVWYVLGFTDLDDYLVNSGKNPENIRQRITDLLTMYYGSPEEKEE